MTAALTIFIVWLIRLCQSRFLPATGSFRALWRFGLADIFVLILFVATVISLGRYCQLPAVAYPVPAFILGFVCSSSCLLLFQRGRAVAEGHDHRHADGDRRFGYAITEYERPDAAKLHQGRTTLNRLQFSRLGFKPCSAQF